jgi:2-polyprenyl-6-methoxyphenol hydroxylase-like FAD-dependent oxidoreductase
MALQPASATPPAAAPRAVVVGASVAGLLAARVLSDHCGEVVVLDRDTLPTWPDGRGGVPQGRHTHGMLAAGIDVLDRLLPGLVTDLVAHGADLGDFGLRSRFHVGPQSLAPGESGLLSLGVSRHLLEWALRARVAALPGVSVMSGTSVLGLNVPTERVTGVCLTGVDTADDGRVLAADVVVDASGRGSRLPEWLTRSGYSAPVEEEYRIDLCYATRTFRRLGTRDIDRALAVVVARSPRLPRGGVALAQEEGSSCIVSLTGVHGQRPPTDLDGFRAYARGLASPVIAEILEQAEPLSEPATYRFPSNRRRYYERAALPGGLLVLGDAWCCFDPVFGQGMSVAALQADELSRCLRARARTTGARRADVAAGLSEEYHRRAARHLDTPWSIAVGNDLEMPGSPYPVPLRTRLTNRYVRALVRAAQDDPALARAFFRVQQLVAPPESLMAPPQLARLLRATARSAAPRLHHGPERHAGPLSVRGSAG